MPAFNKGTVFGEVDEDFSNYFTFEGDSDKCPMVDECKVLTIPFYGNGACSLDESEAFGLLFDHDLDDEEFEFEYLNELYFYR